MTKVRLPDNDTVVRESRAKRFYGLGLIEIHATVRTRKIALKLCRGRRSLCNSSRSGGAGQRRFVIAHEDGRFSAATIRFFEPQRATPPEARPPACGVASRVEETTLFGGAA